MTIEDLLAKKVAEILEADPVYQKTLKFHDKQIEEAKKELDKSFNSLSKTLTNLFN